MPYRAVLCSWCQGDVLWLCQLCSLLNGHRVLHRRHVTAAQQCQSSISSSVCYVYAAVQQPCAPRWSEAVDWLAAGAASEGALDQALGNPCSCSAEGRLWLADWSFSVDLAGLPLGLYASSCLDLFAWHPAAVVRCKLQGRGSFSWAVS